MRFHKFILRIPLDQMFFEDKPLPYHRYTILVITYGSGEGIQNDCMLLLKINIKEKTLA